MSPTAVLLVLVSIACWLLYKTKRAAATEAAAARQAAELAARERDQARGELVLASERLSKLVSAESALTQHLAERDASLSTVRELQRRLDAANAARSNISDEQIRSLNQELLQKRDQLTQLQREIGALDSYSELQSFGLYRPHYAFDAPETYKAELEEIRDRQATMLKEKAAAVFSRQWTVDGSVQKGQVMINRQVKLMLRAFNGECDAALAKVRFNNVIALEERIRNACAAINKLAETYQCAIADGYLELKIAELRLAYEYAVKQQEQREEQRQAREQMREEESVRREIEEEQRDAEREQERAARALEAARAQLQTANQREKDALAAQVSDLEARLAIARAKIERAISMAQLTRAGHVYVISNEGSFGANVYKIGMTRRKEPEERVQELGDASVPFAFDIHAMIYCEDAPELERKLHRVLSMARVNLVNERKEFFAVTLAEIEQAVRACHMGAVEFTKLAVAEQWRRSTLLRAARAENEQAESAKRPQLLSKG